MPILDLRVRLWILAFLAENELGYVPIEISLKLGGFVGAVDDPAIVSRIGVGLRAELETEVFDDIYHIISIARCVVTWLDHTGWGTTQGLSNAAEIDDDGLDTVAFAFDLRH